MIIALGLLFLIFIVSIKPSKQLLTQTYSSIPQTQSIKGLFVITIFFSHFCSYVQPSSWYDVALFKYCEFLGQLMVVPFLFYSGFGIFESVKKRGGAYIKDFPKKRIIKTLIHFDFAVLLFLSLDYFTSQSVTPLNFLFALIAWDSIGNSNWFVFAILCAYIFSYVSLSFFKGNLSKSLMSIFFLSFAYIGVISLFKASYWVDTMLAFPLGCLLSLYKDRFEKIIHNRQLSTTIFFSCLLFFCLAKLNIVHSSFISSQIALITFSLTIIFFSLHFYINSKILNWFGANVFSIYILQRIPMNLLASLHLNELNIYVFFCISFSLTLILSVLFTKWNNFFDKKFFHL